MENKCKQALEGPISRFEDFIVLLDISLTKRQVGEIDVLKNLLPKDRRLIKEDLVKFEQILIKRIQEGKYDKLSLCPAPQQGKKQQYKIEKTQ